MKKLAVIGDTDFSLGFMLAGIPETYEVSSDEEIVKAVEEVLKRDDVGVVIIKQEYLQKLPPVLRREIDEKVEPTFVSVGGTGGVEEIREKIRKAIGVDLWK
ncbi:MULTISPECIES: V-type ATP synthase subunit F [unclassified Archaeoglobus]|jgi:V/A-type H+-transporting ATPase subunit F|uniref:V-type ATP synthase subunit F n=1 Tax=unclassified Archaeoglobus TaxID=2643606 RepID=UPI0025BB0251|nr:MULTISPECIES: V-type ATP synthase subunit F [unclassified Archaeoglobus]